MGNYPSAEVADAVQTQIRQDPVVIYSKTTCGYCYRAKKFFDELRIPYISYELNELPRGNDMFRAVHRQTGCATVPQVFICGKFIGGFMEVVNLHNKGLLDSLVNECAATV